MTRVSQEDIDIVKGSGVFDEKWYLEKYPDVLQLRMDPVEHYLWIGEHMGRKPNPHFCPKSYLSANEDVAASGHPAFLHYVKYGHNEARETTSIKSVKINIQQTPVPTPAALPPKITVRGPDSTLISSSGLFDEKWYISEYGKEVGDEDPILHYLRIGATLGFDPSPNFSTSLYLEIYRDVRAARRNPLLHYIQHGAIEGRSPKPTARQNNLGLLRYSPAEAGTPKTVLEFDSPASPVPGIDREKIAVHVHLYFSEMADEVAGYLGNIRHPFTLLVSVQEQEDAEAWTTFFVSRLPSVNDVIVRNFPNRGRDVASWVVGFSDVLSDSTLFGHIHTKRSTHNRSHNGWFRYLSHTLLGSVGVVDGIFKIFTENERVGFVAPCYFWTLADQPNYGKNKEIVAKLYKRLSSDPLPEQCPDYPAGSFFWARTSALKPLLDLRLKLEDFAEEEGQKDGTVAHGIERVIGFLPALTDTELHLVTVDVAYDLVRHFEKYRTRVAPSIRAPKKNIRLRQEKVALYSCVSGSYESIMPLITNPGKVDRVIFTDAPVEVPSGYINKVSNYISHIPVRTARFVKTHPHVWFSDYDYAVWSDSNVHFFGDLSEYIDELENAGADCAFIPHPVRETYMEEAKTLAEKGIVPIEAVERQTDRYSKDIRVAKSRLIETNFFICRPKSPRVAKFMSLWWGEINRFTHRDQLSVNYAIENSGLKWIELLPSGRSVREHPDFMLFSHRHHDRERMISVLRGF
ncbi:rhamnan synthesis F family protein [Rhizobium sp. SYY.PMSO]|uniref:rhamnan synthesis F family protein n=1 Tax=Rhizobium sp. SYY.PMSO TaxID=3382192 RepID=UPI0039901E9D